jgi:hypothetical protein
LPDQGVSGLLWRGELSRREEEEVDAGGELNQDVEVEWEGWYEGEGHLEMPRRNQKLLVRSDVNMDVDVIVVMVVVVVVVAMAVVVCV